ncbi:MAG: BatD family protein [Bacteroidetes bacterium]|nr:BatD family protein [Bacteroidota bacterium]
MFKQVISFVLLLFFISSLIVGQQFQTTADKTTIGQNERVQVYFEFTGGDNSGIKNFQPPSFSGFRILSGPNQSSSVQIINGSMSASVTFSYVLAPTQIGEFTIGSAAVEFKGSQYKTNPVVIKVIQGAQSAQQKSDDASMSQSDIAENLFIIAEANKRSAYKGEQITVTYKLLTRLEISSPQITKLPTYKGFWAEELEAINNLRFEIEMYKGQRFRSAVLKSVALFPSQSGKLTITPFELNIPVIIQRKKQRGDIFDEFFNDSFFGTRQTVEYLAKSNTLTVDVSELPSNGKPESFNGAVGDFKFSTNLDKVNVETNEPVTLKINISGTGNIKLLEVPKIKLPSGFEQYDPKTSENIIRKNVISGSKIGEYLIVPRVAGEKEIPPIQFSYFNPNSKKYITISSPSYKLIIKRGENYTENSVTGFTKEDVKLLNEDIRYIKTSNFNLEKIDQSNLISTWFWYSIALPFLIFVSILTIKKRQDKLNGNVQLVKYQKAEKNARARLKNAKKALDENDISKFHNEISKAIAGYLEDKLNLQKADFTQDKALGLLKNKNVNDSLIDEVKEILDRCEFIRFAPQLGDQIQSGELHEKTVKVIVNLENSILIRKK